ncbi:MAG: AI-2E family transporter, partial [Bacteroidetes bacterium]
GPNTAAILTLLTFFLIIGLLVLMYVPLVIQQAESLTHVDYSAIARALEEPLREFQQFLGRYGIQPEEVTVERLVAELLSGWFDPSIIGTSLGGIVETIGNLFIGIFSVVFITFFFLREQGLFVNALVALVPEEYEENVRHAMALITRLLSRYFVGIVVQITIITTYVTLALTLLGIPTALLIGFFAAVINVIPYLGPIIGALFGVVITISTNLHLDFYTEMLPLLLKVLAVFASMQLLDNMVLQPWIFSTSVLAHPLEIFLVVMMGARISGIVGMILAIPAYTVLRVIALAFLSEFPVVRKLAGRLKEAEEILEEE